MKIIGFCCSFLPIPESFEIFFFSNLLLSFVSFMHYGAKVRGQKFLMISKAAFIYKKNSNKYYYYEILFTFKITIFYFKYIFFL